MCSIEFKIDTLDVKLSRTHEMNTCCTQIIKREQISQLWNVIAIPFDTIP